MDGPEVFRHAVARMSEVTLDAVQRAGLTLADIDLFVYHQANARITRALGERLGAGARPRSSTASRRSATPRRRRSRGAGRRAGRRPAAAGRDVLLAAFGAGFTWGGGVVEWGGGRDA